MIMSIVFSIKFFLVLATLSGYLSFLVKQGTDELSSARLIVDSKVNLQSFTVSTVNPFILAQEFKGKEPLLIMVIIRARSSIEVNQLQGTHIDIVGIRSDPERPPGDNLFSGGFVVEAVVTADQFNSLKAMGFEISEISEEK